MPFAIFARIGHVCGLQAATEMLMATHDRDEQSFSQAEALRAAGAWQPDAQEVQEMRAALHLVNDRMNRLLASIADGLLMVDRDWRLTYINRRAEDLLRPRLAPDQQRDMLPGGVLWREFPQLAGGAFEAHCQLAMANQQTVTVELEYPPMRSWLEIRLCPAEDGLTCHLYDISGRKADEGALRKVAEERDMLLGSERSARAEAEHSNHMKDEFLATLSHELRTPLSAILGWAQVLRRGTRDEVDLHRGLQSIERNARAQAQLIEDLLDMSRITSGKVLLEMQTILPATIIEAAVEALRPAADAKNIRMQLHVDPNAGAIAGDPSRLQQVMWNLLSNALKFTPRDGRVDISVRPGDAGYVDISIRDNGIGIAAPFLAHVFERFRQADASTTRKHGGLGLGLAIVKHLVEQHGGTVSASSEGLDRGATFTLHLPLAATLPVLPEQAPQLRDLSGLKVLVVDAEAGRREMIRRILGDCHAEVVTAANAAQALHMVADLRPDVLVSDIGMPDIDGFELLALVRALGPECGGALPAIALTALTRPQDRQRALASGFLGHVSKPLQAPDLIAAVAGMAPRLP